MNDNYKVAYANKFGDRMVVEIANRWWPKAKDFLDGLPKCDDKPLVIEWTEMHNNGSIWWGFRVVSSPRGVLFNGEAAWKSAGGNRSVNTSMLPDYADGALFLWGSCHTQDDVLVGPLSGDEKDAVDALVAAYEAARQQ